MRFVVEEKIMLRDSDQGFQYITTYIYDGRRCVASVTGVDSEGKGDGSIWPVTQALDEIKSQH